MTKKVMFSRRDLGNENISGIMQDQDSASTPSVDAVIVALETTPAPAPVAAPASASAPAPPTYTMEMHPTKWEDAIALLEYRMNSSASLPPRTRNRNRSTTPVPEENTIPVPTTKTKQSTTTIPSTPTIQRNSPASIALAKIRHQKKQRRHKQVQKLQLPVTQIKPQQHDPKTPITYTHDGKAIPIILPHVNTMTMKQQAAHHHDFNEDDLTRISGSTMTDEDYTMTDYATEDDMSMSSTESIRGFVRSFFKNTQTVDDDDDDDGSTVQDEDWEDTTAKKHKPKQRRRRDVLDWFLDGLCRV